MRRLGVVAIVVVGLSAIIRALTLLASNSAAFAGIAAGDPGSYVQLAVLVACVAALLGIGVWLVARRECVAAALFPDEGAPVHADSVVLLRIALIVLGVWLALSGAVRLAGAAADWAWRASLVHGYSVDLVLDAGAPWQAAASALVGLAQIAIGLLGVRRSETLAWLLWSRPRTVAMAGGALRACSGCGAPYDPDDYRDIAVARCVECGSPLASGDA